MKTEKIIAVKFQEVRSIMLSAVSGLDLRGTDEQITKAMCVIEATFDAAISGKKITPTVALRRGLGLAKRVAC